MNPEKHPIKCDTIIKWMNKWRGEDNDEDNDASSVPKFVRSEDQNHSDIRVQFDGKYIYTTYIIIYRGKYSVPIIVVHRQYRPLNSGHTVEPCYNGHVGASEIGPY